MICHVEGKDIEDIDKTSILPQTSFWARIKSRYGYKPRGYHLAVSKDTLYARDDRGLVKEDLIVLLKPIDQSHSFAYVPYGPKLEPSFEQQGVFLETLSEELRPHLPRDCVFIRFDLNWESQWAGEDDLYDNSGNWLGPPSRPAQEFRVNFNTCKWNLRKSPGDILPKNTFFLNLRQSEEQLLYNMRYNTRYNIRRAYRKGVRVKEYGIDKLDDWYRLYRHTAKRSKLTMYTREYFSTLLSLQCDRYPGVEIRLMLADYEGEYLASMFLALSHKRGTYLFGASSGHKNLGASYALQWEAIRKAKRNGCLEYDMFGCAPNLHRSHPLHGVHVFKKGFGGRLYHRMGCWDYPYRQNTYHLLCAHELQA
jgi:lipid II:glycine glycyltransferase (peptidoglycan interpeptide bridge formation enzyme)